MKPGEMIVKMQTSMANGGVRSLIYNEKKDFLIEIDTTPLIRAWLNGKQKGFFLARVGNNNVSIIEEVETQTW